MTTQKLENTFIYSDMGQLYSVNYIFNKGWLVSSQAGSIGGTTTQDVEVGQ